MGTKTITSYDASEWSFYRTPGSGSFDEFEPAPGDGIRLILQGQNSDSRYNVTPDDPAVVEYAGLGDLENVTVVAKFTASDVGEIAYGYPGAAIHGRLPGSSAHGAMASITTQTKYGSPKFEIAMNFKHQASDTISSTTSLPFTEWNDGQSVWIRLRLSTYSTGDGGTRVQARCWKDGDPEPASWQLDGGTDNATSNLYLADAPGGIGFGNQSQVSTSYGSNKADDYVRKYLDVTSITIESNEFTGVFPQLETNHIRSSVSEDAGSLLDSVTVNAVDASVSEAFLLDVSLASTTPKNFVEALASGTIAARYYPVPRQSTEFVNDYAGETILSRMARVYPAPEMAKVADAFNASLTTFTVDGTTFASAQQVLTGFFAKWASAYDWFSYATVPDLRLKVPSLAGAGNMTPSEYDDVTASGTLTTREVREYGIVGAEVVFYPQDDDNRLTMRQILDELLAPFPGTVVRANASGELEIVPSYGPDADTSAAITLTNRDAYTVTAGQPSPEGVINRCTVTSQPYVWTEDAGYLTQSWFQVASNGFPGAELYASGTGENLSSDNPRPGSWRPATWKPQSNRFLDTASGIKLTDSSGTRQVSIDYKDECGNSYSGDTSGTYALTDIPADGSTVTAIVWTADSTALRVEIAGRYDKDSGSVQLFPAGNNAFENTNLGCRGLFTPTRHVFRINLLDASDAWQADTKTVSGSFGTSTDDTLPPGPGSATGNAITDSINAYGERDATITMTGYGITDGTTLERVARAYVTHAINPTLVRTVEQSAWRAFPVKFSHMGKLVELPNGEQGRVINRSYLDDFGSNFGEGTMSSTWTPNSCSWMMVNSSCWMMVRLLREAKHGEVGHEVSLGWYDGRCE